MITEIALDCYAITDKGLSRRLNEDSFLCLPDPGLFVVADGMGGASCGDVASKLTAEVFDSSITPYMIDDEATVPFEHTNEEDFFAQAMKHAVEQTNEAVLRAVEENPTCNGMGSTLCAAAFHDGFIHIAHVGDSRLYKFENDALDQVTEDHTRVQEMVNKKLISADEARVHPKRHVITRCIGRKRQNQPDLSKLEIQPDALYLICSDGLYDMIGDDVIAQLIRENLSLEYIADQLVTAANKAGGKDNITVVLFRQMSSDLAEE
jgi:protein phosphatase